MEETAADLAFRNSIIATRSFVYVVGCCFLWSHSTRHLDSSSQSSVRSLRAPARRVAFLFLLFLGAFQPSAVVLITITWLLQAEEEDVEIIGLQLTEKRENKKKQESVNKSLVSAKSSPWICP